MRVGVIGFGNMGGALADCISCVLGNENIIVYDISGEKMNLALDKGYGSASDIYFLCNASDVILVAVKPQDSEKVLKEISEKLEGKLIISTVAGLELKRIYEYTNTRKVIRIMPNINVSVGKGTIAYVCGDGIREKEEKIFLDIMRDCGFLIKIKESMMNAFTALCGSGPAFVAEFIKGLALAGLREGFDYKTSLELAINLVEGTAVTMLKKKYKPEDIISLVSSPAGTTIEGVRYLQEKGFAGTVINCVREAKKRAEEIL